MQRISAKSTERLQGCRDDRDCWTDKCSHDISTIEDDIRAEMGRTKKRHKSKFLPSDGGSPTVTWRHARETDKGKQLEETIEDEEPIKKEAWVLKKGGLRWQKRWFVLQHHGHQPGRLSYYHEQPGAEGALYHYRWVHRPEAEQLFD